MPMNFYPSVSNTPSFPTNDLNRNFTNSQNQTFYNNPFINNNIQNKNKFNKNRKFNKSKLQKNHIKKQNNQFSNFSVAIKLLAKKFILSFVESKIDDWLDELEGKAKEFLLDSMNLNKNENKQHYHFKKSKNTLPTKSVVTKSVVNTPIKNEINAFNAEPFNQPCPLNEFSNNIVFNSDFTTSDVLPTKKENINIMKNSLNQRRQDYNFFYVPQGENNSTVVLNKNFNLNDTFKNMPRNSSIDIREDNSANVLNETFNNENDLQQFINEEMFNSLSNNINDDNIEKTMNMFGALLNANNKNNSESSKSDSFEYESSELPDLESLPDKSELVK